MSTATPQLPGTTVETSKPPVMVVEPESALWSNIKAVLAPLASLKLTVTLFLLSAFIVFAGTLAQVDADIWEVIHNYFRVEILATETFPWISFQPFLKIKLNIFFPPSFFPEEPGFSAGFKWLEAMWPHGVPKFLDGRWFWFPKGWTIGFVMTLNLLAAHLIRFKVQAKGNRLWAGWGVIALGCVVTWLVIMGGSNSDGLQGQALVSYSFLWNVVRVTLLALCGVALYAAVAIESEPAQRWMWGIVSGVLALASLFVANINMAEDEAGMRILYQLVMASLSGLILLAGCVMVFKQRAGIVLLHGGVALLMAYEVLVGTAHVESMMLIEEGKTANFAKDVRDVEIAVTDPSDSETDQVTVIPGRLLKAGAIFDDALLPFKIEILKYYPSSTLLGPMEATQEEKQANPATKGYGKSVLVRAARKSVGTDTEGKVDAASTYARLTDRDGNNLGTYLLSAISDVEPWYLNMFPETQPVSVGTQSYDIALRLKRIYKDYAVTLKDVQKNDYYGTNDPRDYSAFITVTGQDGTSFDQHVWMNNPLRYAGDTMYQHTFIRAGLLGTNSKEMTRLQIVTNQGWMAPYVACMITLVGMLAQFGQSLLRYLSRRSRSQLAQSYAQSLGSTAAKQLTPVRSEAEQRLNLISWIVTAVVLLIPLTWASVGLMPSKPKADKMNLAEFGRLPMWYRGRTMPIDSFARNSLLQLADRETFWNGETPADKKTIKRQAAIEWLLMVMSDPDKARQQHVIRIENLDVLNALDLTKREGLCYSIEELQGKVSAVDEQSKDSAGKKKQARLDKLVELATAASEIPSEKRNLFQKKMIEVGNKVLFYTSLEEAISPPLPLPAPEANQPLDQMHQLAMRAEQYFRYANGLREHLNEKGAPPLVVPTHINREDSGLKELDTKWESPVVAGIFAQFYSEFSKETPPAIAKFTGLLAAAKAGDATKFNQELTGYRSMLESSLTAEGVDLKRTNFEDSYNRFNGFFMASWLYVVAGCLAGLGWLVYPQIFERASFWMIVAILGIHTAALAGRIYISGRPPVTNLYSASVFIGWATVLGGLVIERMSKIGFGNVVAAAAGFLSLRVADGLAADGDTFVVLEAVLDTQFWLATHVVTITLGYATTYLAGFLGVLFILGGVFTPSLTDYKSKEVTRMTYGGALLRDVLQLRRHGPRWTLGRRFLGTLLGLGSQGKRCPDHRSLELSDPACRLGSDDQRTGTRRTGGHR